jgi:hypothetical protein
VVHEPHPQSATSVLFGNGQATSGESGQRWYLVWKMVEEIPRWAECAGVQSIVSANFSDVGNGDADSHSADFMKVKRLVR